MLIFYDEEGQINFTVNGDTPPPGVTESYIEVPDTDLVELSAWRVIGGALQLADLAPLRAGAKARLIEWIEAILARFTADYPVQETLAWGSKLDGARRVVAGDTSSPSTTAILIEAQRKQVSPIVLANKVIAKGAIYEAIISTVSPVRSDVLDAIDAAQTHDQIETAVSAGKSQVLSELATFGVTV